MSNGLVLQGGDRLNYSVKGGGCDAGDCSYCRLYPHHSLCRPLLPSGIVVEVAGGVACHQHCGWSLASVDGWLLGCRFGCGDATMNCQLSWVYGNWRVYRGTQNTL